MTNSLLSKLLYNRVEIIKESGNVYVSPVLALLFNPRGLCCLYKIERNFQIVVSYLQNFGRHS